jgi:hypothetical protein
MSRIWANKNAYRILVGNMNESDCMEDERREKNNIKVDLKVNTVETEGQINLVQVRHTRQ